MYRLPAARSSSGTAGLLKPPTELLAYHRPGEPYLQWGCPAVPLLDGAAMVPGGAHSGRASGVGGDLRAGRTAPRAKFFGWCTGGRPIRAWRGGRLAALQIGDVAVRRRLILVDAVVEDLQDLDGPKHGAVTAEGRELVGVDLWHAAMMPLASRGRPGRVSSGRAARS
jgi:hypothetical protein